MKIRNPDYEIRRLSCPFTAFDTLSAFAKMDTSSTVARGWLKASFVHADFAFRIFGFLLLSLTLFKQNQYGAVCAATAVTDLHMLLRIEPLKGPRFYFNEIFWVKLF